MFRELDNCLQCPRKCGVNRNNSEKGYCGFDSDYHVASVIVHRGEEPPINGSDGICNIFFKGCNLNCTYCQNYQISRRSGGVNPVNPEWLLSKIISCLNQGTQAIGFVSPSHFTSHVKAIIKTLNDKGYHPITVYNTNAYDDVEVLKDLEGFIDVYLPDFKYSNSLSAHKYSGAENYPNIAKAALKEMFRQKGSTVVINNKGQALTGMIIRHLVLPGHSKDSISILEWIASELSTSVHISLMSQYYPTVRVAGDAVLNRYITHEEYLEVVDAMEKLGFYKGWIQDYESHSNYRPDFSKMNPFG